MIITVVIINNLAVFNNFFPSQILSLIARSKQVFLPHPTQKKVQPIELFTLWTLAGSASNDRKNLFIERLDQGRLHPLLGDPRYVPGNRTQASMVGGEHSSKELFEQLVFGPSTWAHDMAPPSACTVRKKDLILRPIERRPQMQFSIARRFKLKLLRRYSVKFYKMRNFTLGKPWFGKLKNTSRRRTSILRICSLWLYHCATVTCDTCAVF